MPIKNQITNTETLRRVLGEEVERLRNRQSSCKDLNAISTACAKIVASAKLELDYCKISGRKPPTDFFAAV